MIDYLNENKDVNRLPGIVALGYVGAYHEKSASTIIESKGVQVLKESLIQIPDDLVKGAAAWALGQIGGHSYKHANPLANEEVLTHLLAVYIYQNSTEELKKKAKKAIKNIVVMCT
jgi:3-methyladenine DNA glycosylase AlkD